jgi:uncharacterized protein (TIGR03118 family)
MIPAPGSTTIKSVFLFDTLDGTIQGWNPGSNAGLRASEPLATIPGAIFTGLALANSGGANYLYAANAAGSIYVFDSIFKDVTKTTFAGKFVDPNPVPGFTPYNIQALSDGNLYVTYAAATKTGAPLPGGYVDKFDTAGNFLGRIATNGPINAPWGLAIAPKSGFGPFSGDLLVGNLYNSKIDAFNPTTLKFDGSITVNTGFASPVGLWALAFGNGKTGLTNTLYFTSGINDQKDGLFGSVSFVPEPGSGLLLILGGVTIGLFQVARALPTRRGNETARSCLSRKLLESVDDCGELAARIAGGVGPDGQESTVTDLFERSQIFLPVECASRKTKTARVKGLDSGRPGRVAGVGMNDPRVQFLNRLHRIDPRAEQAGRVDAGPQPDQVE